MFHSVYNLDKNNDERRSKNDVTENMNINDEGKPGKMLNIISPVSSTSKINEIRRRSRLLAEIVTIKKISGKI